ncbi:sugar kinase [Carnimonas nigrificans]|uniref:sugar kinase n=1 Tax=Carnimonas nigrificans TaxID=64323 RepID=UPI00047196E9|nr:sugar kinase [Carnimonas nigrificans]
MPTIMTLGEILVEFLADQKNQRFDTPGVIRGPFPSGAPAIFIDQVAKLGGSGGIIGCIGEDDFGRLNLNRLNDDGVDTRHIRVLPNETTGSAFVSYQDDGSRNFIYNLTNSASSKITPEQVTEASLKGCSVFHVMGSSLFSFKLIEATQKAINIVKAQGGKISFDPNIRKEMLAIPEMREALVYILELSDIVIPSEGELELLVGHNNEEQAVKELFEGGVEEIIIKLGARGSQFYQRDGTALFTPGFSVAEIDPTGAGDCFGATYLGLRAAGLPVEKSLVYANAAGAFAVQQSGPMEGTSRFQELEAFVEQQGAV